MENLEKRITVGQEKFDKSCVNLCGKINHSKKKNLLLYKFQSELDFMIDRLEDLNGDQTADVGDVGLDVGAEVGVPPQAPVDLHDHPLLNVLQLLITAKVSFKHAMF